MTLLLTTLVIMTILIKLYAGKITYNDTTYDWFYLWMTSIITANKNIYVMSHLCYMWSHYKLSLYKSCHDLSRKDPGPYS
jgi:hypothetical protein